MQKMRFVPRGYARSQLMKADRIVKLEFRRNMSRQEVIDIITSGFSKFDGNQNARYFTCGEDNVLCVLDERDLDGGRVFEVARQGSLYLIEEPAAV